MKNMSELPKKRLLIVHKDPITRKFLQMKLEDHYDLEIIESGEELIEKLRSIMLRLLSNGIDSSIDAIITACQLKEISGLEFAAKVREVRKDIPLILFTDMDKSILTDQDKSNFSEIIMRDNPTQYEHLIASIEKLLNNSSE